MSTIDYYDQNAQEYYERTVDADLAEIREYFLGFLRRDARILDFGCGSGRDAKAFAEAGRTVEALDGSQELCRIASEYLGMDVRNMMFQDFEETEAYDGLWACASILHLTYEENHRACSIRRSQTGPSRENATDGIIRISKKRKWKDFWRN